MNDDSAIVQRIYLIEVTLKYIATMVAGIIVILVSTLAFFIVRPLLGTLIAGGLALILWPLLGRVLTWPTRNLGVHLPSD
jgi:hypothetical protein